MGVFSSLFGNEQSDHSKARTIQVTFEDVEISVPAKYDEDQEYVNPNSKKLSYIKVNPHKVTCNCSDFVKKRSHLPIDSIQRLCKHLIDEVGECYSQESSDHPITMLLEDFKKEEHYEWVNDQVIIAYTLEKPKVQVYIGDKHDYGRYVYDTEKHRWSGSEREDAEIYTEMHMEGLPKMIEARFEMFKK